MFRRRPLERPGFLLYGAAVAAARDPLFHTRFGVADTLDGRFDLASLHVALLIRRLRHDADPRGAPLAQAVFDAMFSDMDVNLREMGVGDLSVGKKMRKRWEAFHGRALAYETALDAGDDLSLAAALERNVWRGAAPKGAAARLAGLAMAQDRHLAAQPFAALVRGEANFLPLQEVLHDA